VYQSSYGGEPLISALKSHLRLAVPNVLSNLTVPLAGLVDTVLLGHQDSSEPLAGVALAGTIFSFLFWGFAFLRMGTTGLTSNAVGADEKNEVGSILVRSLGIALALGLVMIAGSPLIEWVSFLLLQGDPAVESQGRLYFQARIWGAPAVLGLMVLNGWFLGRLLSKHVLLLSAVQNSLLLGLDYLFIWKWGWGAAGAGYSTALAAGLAFLFALILVKTTWVEIPGLDWDEIWRREKLGLLFSLNSQIFVRSFFLILTVTSFTNISAWMSETIVAANAILLQLLLSCAYFVDGYAYALESLAGVAAGKRDWQGVRTQLRTALFTSTVTTILFATTFILGSEEILSRMTAHPEINALALSLLPYFVGALFLASFSYIYDGLCTGLTWGRELKISVIAACIIGFLPLALLAIQLSSPKVLWVAYMTFSGLRSLVLGVRSERALSHRISEARP